MNTDIDNLNLRELTSLLVAAEKRKQFLSKRRSAALVRQQAIALAARHGYTIEELFGDQAAAQPTRRKRGSSRKPAKVAPKYRDPDNDGQAEGACRLGSPKRSDLASTLLTS